MNDKESILTVKSWGLNWMAPNERGEPAFMMLEARTLDGTRVGIRFSREQAERIRDKITAVLEEY